MLKAIPTHRPWYVRVLSQLDKLVARNASAGLSNLRSLDAAAMRDIGIDRSEIDSIESESAGYAALTRQRVRAGVWNV